MRAALLLALAWPLAAAAPAPADYFGHPIGADRTVLDWDKTAGYFEALAKTSPRVRVDELGKTTEGGRSSRRSSRRRRRSSTSTAISDIQRRLADPRITSEAEAAALAREGKVVVMITCAIHSTEIAATQTAVEFAYRLATEDTPRLRTILENTVFILVPSLNPDGQDIVTRWYRKTLGTPYEGTSPPELYNKYLGHDNNRDWYIHSQAGNAARHSQAAQRVASAGGLRRAPAGPLPQSRIFVPPWLDPIEPNVDAILVQEMNMLGTSMALDLTAAGKTGVAINASYDFWTPARHYQAFHGGHADPDRIGQRAAGEPGDGDGTDRAGPERARLRPAAAELEFSSRGRAARGACATSSTTS